jgi:trk system potassium uptake protein TrkH
MKIRRLSQIQILSVGFVLISIVGGVLLSLPIASTSGEATPYIDALFTSTSAVTTTGLVVVDTGSHYNLFGQTVIMILFQIGGLGYMLFFVFFVLSLGNKLSMKNKLLLQESLKRPFKIEAVKFTRQIILFTVIVESVGAAFLSMLLLRDFSLPHAVYSGLFHSISAFNTAGFSIYADSFSRYNNSMAVNIILIFVFTAGCLGFWVVFDSLEYFRNILKRKKPNRLSVHSKLVYLITILFFVAGTCIIYFSEPWANSISIRETLLNSIFQTLTATSTTGFNTIDIGGMTETSLFLIIGFMFIGAGSGSTAGGIKMTTFGVLIASVYSILKNKEDVSVFKHRISVEIVRHSTAIMLLAGLWMFLAILILCVTEKGKFISILFEVVSALGTVGLSTGITADLSHIGKSLIVVTMLIGRIGPLGVGLSVLREHKQLHQYPQGDIYVG